MHAYFAGSLVLHRNYGLFVVYTLVDILKRSRSNRTCGYIFSWGHSTTVNNQGNAVKFLTRIRGMHFPGIKVYSH